jgi:hypothetical protein
MVVHDRFGLIVLIVAVAGALLALIAVWRPQLWPAVAAFLRLELAAVVVQVIIGLVLVATGDRPQDALHWVYGAATLLSLPVTLFVGRSRGARQEVVWVTGGAVATMLLAFRAVTTG